MKALNIVSAVLVIVGGLNWGLVGAFDFDLVATLFGEMSAASRIVYVLVGISAIVKLAGLKSMQRARYAGAAAALGLMLLAPAGLTAQSAQGNDIVDVAVGAGQFTTLVAAVKAAGLVETLKGAGPFTVFAPTDAAFAKLPKGTVEGLLADKQKLAAILTYHVVAGKTEAGAIVKARGAKPKTVNGEALDIVIRGGKVFVNGAQVVTADIQASNGVIHVIDTVLLPGGN